MNGITEHKATFRPRTRLLELLGDQLFRHHRIALFELEKNIDDTDSQSLNVLLKNIQIKYKELIEEIALKLALSIRPKPDKNWTDDHFSADKGKKCALVRFGFALDKVDISWSYRLISYPTIKAGFPVFNGREKRGLP